MRRRRLAVVGRRLTDMTLMPRYVKMKGSEVLAKEVAKRRSSAPQAAEADKPAIEKSPVDKGECLVWSVV